MTGLFILLPLFFLLLAVFLRFALKGYSYLAHLSVLIAGLILLHAFLPAGLWRIVQILTAAGILVFLIFEIPVLLAARTDPNPGRKYLVVLGAEVVGTRPSRSLNYRLNAAQAYLERYPESLCVVSGGKGEKEEISEAECMFRVLTERGIAAERILREDRSTSTMENLSLSFALIRSRGDDPDGNTALLSASYHLCRAKRMARSLGMRSVCVAAHPGNPFLAANFFIREAFGMMHLMLFGK
jgi:uncharacterized SAM-binding protein YcdF (DUF218 family)